jgi:ubiquinone/menaquinone biosynthesis C-methylase UbiE
MVNPVERHYSEDRNLAQRIADAFRAVGKELRQLRPQDLASVDEFHVRGRKATLELAARMGIDARSTVLDIGSGLGGPARTLAETYGCAVVGIDLTTSFCEAAAAMSEWVGLAHKVTFRQADATALPFPDHMFDAAMTLHVCMNISDKHRVYAEAKRVLKPGAIFAAYDITQGEGGEVHYPVPWARDPSISHLVTSEEMRRLLEGAGFRIREQIDSSDEGLVWFRELAARVAGSGPPTVTFQTFFGDDFPLMARNQVRNLAERRIRTLAFICER